MIIRKNNILIITGGQVDIDFLIEHTDRVRYDKIIAADKGLVAADQCNILLDYIVGDFDSVSVEILEKYKGKSTPIDTFPTEKDKSDTQIAIELALMHSPKNIDIIGATGTRLDHVLANIHLLLLPLQLGIDACMMDKNNRIYLKKESFSMEKKYQYGEYVSLLPFSEKVSGLTLKGFKYPLNHVTLSAGNSLGISNEIKEEVAMVELIEGTLLVIEARD